MLTSHRLHVLTRLILMTPSEPSKSAMSAAVGRGTHRLWDNAPWIFDDPFALVLVGPTWPDFATAIRAIVPSAIFRQGHAFLQIRSRYPEDRLAQSRYEQYVVLGAGLDSFAWRCPEMLRKLRFFEVDHPATQDWKRARASSLGLPISPNHVFVPVDLDTSNLDTALTQAGFDWSVPTLFCWVGTTMYLEPSAVGTTLAVVSRCASGSEIALSYNLTSEFMDEPGRQFLRAITPKLADQDEPVRNGFSPNEMEGLVSSAGLVVADHPTSAELAARYCATRDDDLKPSQLERLIAAKVS
jgi:methyltransferase (TIGR00027 family)